MSNIKVIGDVIVKEGNLDFVKSEIEKLLEPTRAEEGNVSYLMTFDSKNKNRIVMIEEWESEELLNRHLANEPIQNYIKATDGMIDLFNVSVLNPSTK